MVNDDKKSEGTMMIFSMIVMKMLIVAMMMIMMMQLAICKTDKWQKHNPSGSPLLPNGHKCKTLLTRLYPIAQKLQSLVLDKRD